MKSSVLTSTIAVVLLAQGVGAHAGDKFDSVYLLKSCKLTADEKIPVDNREAYDAGFCRGMLNGFLTTFFYGQQQAQGGFKTDDGRTVPVPSICLPKDGISAAQARLVLVGYLERHPELLHGPGEFLVYSAFANAFQCPADPTVPGKKNGPPSPPR